MYISVPALARFILPGKKPKPPRARKRHRDTGGSSLRARIVCNIRFYDGPLLNGISYATPSLAIDTRSRTRVYVEQNGTYHNTWYIALSREKIIIQYRRRLACGETKNNKHKTTTLYSNNNNVTVVCCKKKQNVICLCSRAPRGVHRSRKRAAEVLPRI